MAAPLLLCTDGSDLALRALRAGLDLLLPGRAVVVTVVSAADPGLVTGTGFASGVLTPDMYEELLRSQQAAGAAVLAETVGALGLAGADTVVLVGEPGPAICDYAVDVGARAIVIGSRGRGGVRRALLGSVSDHVVRNAPCPVLVTGAPDDDATR